MIVLDTNIVSELMREVPDPAVRDWLSSLGETPLSTTALTVAEISYGLARLPDGRRRAALEARFAACVGPEPGLPILELDETAARESGRLRAIRVAAGLGAHPTDMLIAGIVAATGADLATRNVKDFTGLPIRVVDPWGGAPARGPKRH